MTIDDRWGNLIISDDQLWNLNRFPPLIYHSIHNAIVEAIVKVIV